MRSVFADSKVLNAGAGSRSGSSWAVLTVAEIDLLKFIQEIREIVVKEL